VSSSLTYSVKCSIFYINIYILYIYIYGAMEIMCTILVSPWARFVTLFVFLRHCCRCSTDIRRVAASRDVKMTLSPSLRFTCFRVYACAKDISGSATHQSLIANIRDWIWAYRNVKHMTVEPNPRSVFNSYTCAIQQVVLYVAHTNNISTSSSSITRQRWISNQNSDSMHNTNISFFYRAILYKYRQRMSEISNMSSRGATYTYSYQWRRQMGHHGTSECRPI